MCAFVQTTRDGVPIFGWNRAESGRQPTPSRRITMPVPSFSSPATAASGPDEERSCASAVSWGAILAGAAGAASLSLILLVLGTGLGLSSVSPWAMTGIGVTAFGVSTILWVTLTQVIAAGMGGYLAGRLRKRWIAAQADEVYFRDTAHGFLSWAVASLVTAALLSSVIGSIVGSSVQAGAAVASSVVAVSGKMTSMADTPQMAYFVDILFRRDAGARSMGANGPVTAAEGAEVGRIFMNVRRPEPLPPEDMRYVGQLVAQHTGLSQQDAEKRVVATYTRAQTKVHDAEVTAREAANKARKASAYGALWLFVSLLAGAFMASLAAIYGGRQRDA